jgi:hypothetical protein
MYFLNPMERGLHSVRTQLVRQKFSPHRAEVYTFSPLHRMYSMFIILPRLNCTQEETGPFHILVILLYLFILGLLPTWPMQHGVLPSLAEGEWWQV